MHPEEFREMDGLEASHWWFLGKRLVLDSLLVRAKASRVGRFLDLGCGTGGILQTLQSRGGGLVVGVDRSPLALQFCRERGLEAVVLGDAVKLPFSDGVFGICVMMDILEHIDDEVGLLREAGRVLRPGGAALISVPAFQALWSQHDVTFEHRRRYRRHDLESRVCESGLRVQWSSYTNFFVFAPALLWRTVRRWTGLAPTVRTDFIRVPRPINEALVVTYRLEAALLRHLSLPFGVSVVCVARRT
jgi:SAM-dependent methyltransferase